MCASLHWPCLCDALSLLHPAHDTTAPDPFSGGPRYASRPPGRPYITPHPGTLIPPSGPQVRLPPAST